MYHTWGKTMFEGRSNSDVVRLRLPPELRVAVFALATRDFTSASAIIRQAVADRVRREGVTLGTSDGNRKG